MKPSSKIPTAQNRDWLVSCALNDIRVSKEPLTKYFKLGKIIGDGKFGTVREAHHVDFPDQTVAIKTIKLSNVTEHESLL